MNSEVDYHIGVGEKLSITLTRFGQIRKARCTIQRMDYFRSLAMLKASNAGITKEAIRGPLNTAITETWNWVYHREGHNEKAYTKAATSLNDALGCDIFPLTISGKEVAHSEP